MRLLPVLTCAVLAVAAADEGRVRYDGYSVLSVTPTSEAHVHAIQRLEDPLAIFKVNMWKRASMPGRAAHIMVSPATRPLVLAYFNSLDIAASVYIDDVQKQIDEEALTIAQGDAVFRAGQQPKDFTFDQYHSFDEIAAYLQSVATTYPALVNISSIGKSHEHRDLWLLKIGHASTSAKPGFWIDAGIHAREWVAPATALYIINELVTKDATDPTITKLLGTIDFYILASFNPDGYEYSRDKDRLWRKTRSGPYKGFLGERCYGVDPNRNWDFEWGKSGASKNPCSEIYEGKRAFSEVECAAGAAALTSLKDTLKAMITFHSYSEDILYPYGYKTHTYPPDVQELKDLGDLAAAATKKVHGTKYAVINSADGLYPAAGASDDWSKHLGIKWVYTIELRPGDGDQDGDSHYGFELPASYIQRTADEIWAGVLVMANRVMTGPN